MIRHAFSFAALLTLLAVAPAVVTAQTSHGIPGAAPGTERWIVMLRNRGYSLQQALQSMQAQTTLAARQAALASLHQAAANDQAAIAQSVAALGGTVERHYWILSALAVQVPPSAVAPLRGLPRVRRMVPVRACPTGDASADVGIPPPAPPIQTSTDQYNHNVAAAWTILGNGSGQYQGAGARVAVFDTGIDEDILGTNGVPDLHPGFVDGAGLPRIEAHLRAQAVNQTTRHADINACQPAFPYVGLVGPFGFRPALHHDNAAHGTAMASIIACRPYTTVLGAGASFAATGHAPDAHLVDVACSSYDGPDARSRWIFTDPAYLGGIQALREWIILNRPPGQTAAYVHVANFSIGGDPFPNNPISLALDALARDEDILLVAMAGTNSTKPRRATASTTACRSPRCMPAIRATPACPSRPTGRSVRWCSVRQARCSATQLACSQTCARPAPGPAASSSSAASGNAPSSTHTTSPTQSLAVHAC